MKANEAPKKIYFGTQAANPFYGLTRKCANDDIEYVRLDAFIDKVKEFLWAHTPGTDYHVNYIVKKFEKYMEE